MNRLRSLITVSLTAAAVGSWASGCSLTREKAECASTTECRLAFGTGHVCTDEGLCEMPAVNPACSAQFPSDLLAAPEKYKNYVVLGSLLRAEGKEGARHDAAKLAVEAVNGYLVDHEDRHPDLQGVRFGLVQCDHDGDVHQVADLAEYLVETIQAPAILGPASSSATAASFSRVNLSEDGQELRRVVFVSPSATSVALTELESQKPGMLWRTAPTDDGQGRLMGQYAVDSDMPFLAFYEETPYGEGLFARLQEVAGNLCNDCGISFEADTDDVVTLTRELARDSTLDALAEVEIVFFIGAQESHLTEMMERLARPEFDGKTLFLSDAAASADTVGAVAGDNVDRVMGTRPRAAEDGEATRFFTGAYEGRHDESPLIHSFTAHAYDATWLVLLSSLHARLEGDAISPETIARGMRRMTSDNWADLAAPDDGGDASDTCPLELQSGSCPPLTLDATYLKPIIESLDTIGRVDVQGASGSLDYNPQTEELANSSDAFEFWYLDLQSEDTVSIVGGMPGSN